MISSIIYGSAKHLLESCSDEITHFLTCSHMRQFRVCLEIWTFQGWISYPWFLLKLDGYFLLVGSFSQKLWICFSIIETLGIVIVALYVRCFFRGHHIVWVLPRLSQMSLHLRSHTDSHRFHICAGQTWHVCHGHMHFCNEGKLQSFKNLSTVLGKSI
jgi:hypothetical protein